MLQCGTDNDDDKQLKIELLSQWKLEAEFRKNGHNTQSATAAARDIGRERESERRGQKVMKEKMMEVERK